MGRIRGWPGPSVDVQEWLVGYLQIHGWLAIGPSVDIEPCMDGLGPPLDSNSIHRSLIE